MNGDFLDLQYDPTTGPFLRFFAAFMLVLTDSNRVSCYAFSRWYVSEGTLQRDVAGCDSEGWKLRFCSPDFTSFMFTTFLCTHYL